MRRKEREELRDTFAAIGSAYVIAETQAQLAAVAPEKNKRERAEKAAVLMKRRADDMVLKCVREEKEKERERLSNDKKRA
ncbi:MAG: hypothetical protein LUD19_03020 [Clostridia bacterium]|nr:hypothetical protein [Clostridia bacterium]